MTRQLTAIEAGMAETIKQLEKDKAELVDRLWKLSFRTEDYTANTMRDELQDIASEISQKHGSNQ